MAVTSWHKFTQNGSVYTGWVNPEFVYESDDQWAMARAIPGVQEHDFAGLQFTNADLPPGSVVNYAEVSVEAHAATTPGKMTIALFIDGADQGPGVSCDAFTSGPDIIVELTSPTFVLPAPYGRDDYLRPDFGILAINSGWSTLYIDQIKMRLYYTAPLRSEREVHFTQEPTSDVTFKAKTLAIVSDDKLVRFVRKAVGLGRRNFTKPVRFPG